MLTSTFLANFLAQQASPAVLALSAQQPDLELSQVLASPACKAGMKAKAARVKQRASFFIMVLLMAVCSVNPPYIANQTFLSTIHSKFCLLPLLPPVSGNSYFWRTTTTAARKFYTARCPKSNCYPKQA